MAGTQRDPRFNIGMQTDWRGQQYELLTIEPCKRQGRRQPRPDLARQLCQVWCALHDHNSAVEDPVSEALLPDLPLNLASLFNRRPS